MVLGLAGTFCVASGSGRSFIRAATLGGLPYLGAAGTTVYLAREAQLAGQGLVAGIDPGVASTILDQALNFQVTYGAILLSMLGKICLSSYGFQH